MSDEKRKILEMLEAGIITQEDAVRLLEAVGEPGEPQPKEKEPPRLTLYPDGPLNDTDTIEQTQEAAEQAQAEAIPALPAQGTPYDYPEIGAEPIESLQINWVTGPVEVRLGDTDTLKVTEYANRPLGDRERLQMRLHNGELTIHWVAEGWSWRGIGTRLGLSKHLVVELPRSQQALDEVHVSTVSGNLYIQGLTGDDMSFSTVSGSLSASWIRGDDVSLTTVSGTISAHDVTGDDLNFHSTSGAIEAIGFQGDDVNFSTVSGKIRAVGTGDEINANSTSGSMDLRFAVMPDSIQFNTTSGRSTAVLPDDPKGFTASYSTMSGKFTSDYPLSGDLGKKNGSGSYAGGETEISFHSLSGSMEIKKA